MPSTRTDICCYGLLCRLAAAEAIEEATAEPAHPHTAVAILPAEPAMAKGTAARQITSMKSCKVTDPAGGRGRMMVAAAAAAASKMVLQQKQGLHILSQCSHERTHQLQSLERGPNSSGKQLTAGGAMRTKGGGPQETPPANHDRPTASTRATSFGSGGLRQRGRKLLAAANLSFGSASGAAKGALAAVNQVSHHQSKGTHNDDSAANQQRLQHEKPISPTQCKGRLSASPPKGALADEISNPSAWPQLPATMATADVLPGGAVAVTGLPHRELSLAGGSNEEAVPEPDIRPLSNILSKPGYESCDSTAAAILTKPVVNPSVQQQTPDQLQQPHCKPNDTEAVAFVGSPVAQPCTQGRLPAVQPSPVPHDGVAKPSSASCADLQSATPKGPSRAGTKQTSPLLLCEEDPAAITPAVDSAKHSLKCHAEAAPLSSTAQQSMVAPAANNTPFVASAHIRANMDTGSMLGDSRTTIVPASVPTAGGSRVLAPCTRRTSPRLRQQSGLPNSPAPFSADALSLGDTTTALPQPPPEGQDAADRPNGTRSIQVGSTLSHEAARIAAQQLLTLLPGEASPLAIEAMDSSCRLGCIKKGTQLNTPCSTTQQCNQTAAANLVPVAELTCSTRGDATAAVAATKAAVSQPPTRRTSARLRGLGRTPSQPQAMQAAESASEVVVVMTTDTPSPSPSLQPSPEERPHSNATHRSSGASSTGLDLASTTQASTIEAQLSPARLPPETAPGPTVANTTEASLPPSSCTVADVLHLSNAKTQPTQSNAAVSAARIPLGELLSQGWKLLRKSSEPSPGQQRLDGNSETPIPSRPAAPATRSPGEPVAHRADAPITIPLRPPPPSMFPQLQQAANPPVSSPFTPPTQSRGCAHSVAPPTIRTCSIQRMRRVML